MNVIDLRRAAAKLARAKRLARERALETRFAGILAERTRLAREIHDSLLQGATGVALQLRALLPKLGDAPPETGAALRRIVELAESTIRDARRAVCDIRSSALVQKGLPEALRDEATRAAGDLALRFAVHGTVRPLSAAVEDTLFRIGREAAANAVKHAGAQHVSVDLTYRPQSIRLVVSDDGAGFRVEPVIRATGGRWGLLGMRERAESIGAALTIRSAPGKGTTVEVRARVARLVRRGRIAASDPESRAS